MSDARFPIGHTYTSAGKAPRQCVVADIHRTYNNAGELIRLRYVAAHDFMGQTVLRYDVTDTEIAKGST